MEKKVVWWKQALAFLLDAEWHLDPYKLAGFVLLGLFCAIVCTVMSLVQQKADIGLIGIDAGLLLPITTMITFMFNFSKQSDAKLTDAAIAASTPPAEQNDQPPVEYIRPRLEENGPVAVKEDDPLPVGDAASKER